MRALNGPALFAIFSIVLSIASIGLASADTGCSERNPLITIFPSSITSPPGQTVAFTVQVKNDDFDNCPIKPFYVSATSNNLTVSISPGNFTLAPGEAQTSLLKVVVPSDAPTKDYDVVVTTNDVNFTSSQTTTVQVRPQVESCQVQVSNLRFKATTSNQFSTSFNRSEVGVYSDLALLGNNVVSNVTLQLFVNGNLFDSISDFYSGNSITTVKFKNNIHTDNFADNVNVMVKALPYCNPANSDETSTSFSIQPVNEKVHLTMVIGTPNETVVNNNAVSRIFLRNVGTENTTANVDGFLCDTTNNCETEMLCGNSILFIAPDQTQEIDCRVNITARGTYRVQGVATFGEQRIAQNSLDFRVVSYLGQTAPSSVTSSTSASSANAVNQIAYVCSGSLRQAVYTTNDGTKTSDIEYCPRGCNSGSCIETGQPGKTIQNPSLLGNSQEVNQPVFSPPEQTSIITQINGFIDWIKNLLFPRPN